MCPKARSSGSLVYRTTRNNKKKEKLNETKWKSMEQSKSDSVLGSFIFLSVAYFRQRNGAYIDRQKVAPTKAKKKTIRSSLLKKTQIWSSRLCLILRWWSLTQIVRSNLKKNNKISLPVSCSHEDYLRSVVYGVTTVP